ncbi:MAG: DNA-protecting protein DprA [Planctomycetes bacterium]|nr:DNA-protecting protein DprA [Planctomycetota bacterium]
MDPYLLLAAAEGCGPGMIRALLDPEPDPSSLLTHPPPNLPPAVRARLDRGAAFARASRWLARAMENGWTVLTPTDPRFPPAMRDAPLRPNALFARGDATLLATPRASLAVVGSRTPTGYGEAAALDFAGAAARAGIVLWSGLAYGVDALAHEQALRHGTPTVAVVAGGLDRVYPARHTDLAARIVAAGGLVVSEAPPGMRALRGHFPRRNRILAAGAAAVLVVEAGLRSGTLHTAQFAGELGVPVFCVPGPYTSPRSSGCHALIAAGCGIACSPDELLRDLDVVGSLGDPDADPRRLELSADQEAILRTLRAGPRPTDLVAQACGLTPPRFRAALLVLTELQWIRRLPGDRVMRA